MPDAHRTLVAGVDSSTQSCKVVVCDATTGEVVRAGRAAHPEGTEVHPDRWWEAYQQATVDDLLAGVSAIAVGGQQHGMCALDEEGAVVRDALLWNDTGPPRPRATSSPSWGRRRGLSAPGPCPCPASPSPRSAGWPSTSPTTRPGSPRWSCRTTGSRAGSSSRAMPSSSTSRTGETPRAPGTSPRRTARTCRTSRSSRSAGPSGRRACCSRTTRRTAVGRRRRRAGDGRQRRRRPRSGPATGGRGRVPGHERGGVRGPPLTRARPQR